MYYLDDLTFAYYPDGLLDSMHKITVDGAQNRITWQNLVHVGERTGVTHCEDIIDEVVEVISGWPHIARQANVDRKIAASIKSTY